ncbi:multi-sensor signal transduction histidine kinase [Rhizorhabdus wittichii RW1]|uniref:histidine kinase n=2 Tax=Rhizorhabdus wittichii TaxID=160791 RepID=A0A9J9LCB2_RHIWR|nr:multi-sensor signal transduction histidine kinase [Rhizorhabdus wittichii RW1]QTH22569.1 PAS domain-containing sensor histidine kinase [Rhizorhabdus wittichii]
MLTVFPKPRPCGNPATMAAYGLVSRRWRRRAVTALRPRRLLPLLEILAPLAALLVVAVSYRVVTASGKPEIPISPTVVALLLGANLLSFMVLMVLAARRVALHRAARSGLGGKARLHVRLVAFFSLIATAPTLLVVIFASLLFQLGTEFWFSDKATVVLRSSERVAQAYVTESKERLLGDILAMSGDLRSALSATTIDDPRFAPFFARQVAYRGLSEAAIISVDRAGTPQLIALANLDKRPLDKRLPPATLPFLAGGQPRITAGAGDRIEGTILLDAASRTYLYISRQSDRNVLAQAARARSALGDYVATVDRARALQLRFNILLMIIALAILGIAIWVAMTVADRLVRPVNDLVAAARRVAAGDLSARVHIDPSPDEIGTLGSAFNRMTRKLGEQTGALVAANSQLESRSAFIEAVLSGVTAGVISVDGDRRITLVNPSARAMLALEEPVDGRPLADISPELHHILDAGDREAVVQIVIAGEPRTLSVRAVAAEGARVLTFDDITQRLADQRRAAWADVARRIAHEIKNPLTPIQLAAERLQRRYGKEIQSDPGVFERLTATIVRQVGDMRRIVDEFSSFARMPKPAFREEAIVDIARQAMFLQEVAHPAISFSLDSEGLTPTMICDRRQLGQALTNLVKNAVEAIEENPAQHAPGVIAMTIRIAERRLRIVLADNGPGLPPERERLTEPYMTTRKRGTGLGLAIVRKIVEDHLGTLALRDRPGGGTMVEMDFDLEALGSLAVEGADRAGNAAEEAKFPELKRSGTG